ncbi:MAG: pyrroline-5-carboxylate reductase family protein [Thermoplasmatota archaeon]
MNDKTAGFIGGGRITRIFLEGFQRAGKMPRRVVVSDVDADILGRLKTRYPMIEIAPKDNRMAASSDIVFLAVHPPAMRGVLEDIKSSLKPEALIISFAPAFTMEKLSLGLNGFRRIGRMIPNACSIVNEGFNPVAFSPDIPDTEKEELLEMLGVLGKCPMVDEEKLEAYAVITAMGPTYLWFQLHELLELGKSFGLTPQEVSEGLASMLEGASRTMFQSGISPTEVMDLIPSKPLKGNEEEIRGAYRKNLEGIFRKLKGLG